MSIMLNYMKYVLVQSIPFTLICLDVDVIYDGISFIHICLFTFK